MWQPSQIPMGPFAQAGMGAEQLSQSAQNWGPIIMNMIQEKRRRSEQDVAAAGQAVDMAKALYPTDPTKWMPAMQHFQEVAQASGIPAWKGFQWPQAGQQPPAQGAQGAPQGPPPLPTGTLPWGRPEGGPGQAATAPPMMGAPPAPSTAAFGAPEAGAGAQAQAAPVPSAPAAAPGPQYGFAVPGTPWEQMTTRQQYGNNPAVMNRMVQLAGTDAILDMPYTEALKQHPQIGTALATMGAGTVADYFRKAGIPMDANDEKAMSGMSTADPAFMVDGVPSQAKMTEFVQNYQRYGAEAALRGLQVTGMKLDIKTKEAALATEQQKTGFDYWTRRYAAATMRPGGADPQEVERVLSAASSAGINRQIVQSEGDAYASDLAAKKQYLVKGPSGQYYPLKAGEAFSAEMQQANQDLANKNFGLHKDEVDLAKKRYNLDELQWGQKINTALENSLKLDNSDAQALALAKGIMSGTITTSHVPQKSQDAIINRAVQIMRSKLGIDVTVDDFKKPITATGQTNAGHSVVDKVLGWITRQRGGSVVWPGDKPPVDPNASQGTGNVPVSTGTVPPAARVVYTGWLKSGMGTVPSKVWDPLDPATKQFLENLGVPHQ